MIIHKSIIISPIFAVIVLLHSMFCPQILAQNSGPQVVSMDTLSSEGTMEGVNLQRTGVYPTKAVYQLNSILWKSSKLFEINYAKTLTSEFDGSLITVDIGFSDPILANGLIYIRLTNSLTQNYIAAVNGETGQGVWTFKNKEFLSAPTVAGDSVYVVSVDGNFYALDARTGTVNWKYSSKGLKWNSYAAPVVINGVAYCVGLGGYLYAIDLTTKQARLVFKAKHNLSSGAFNQDTVYVGSKGILYAVDIKTGREKWNFPADSSTGRPVIAQETVLFRTQEGNLFGVDLKTGQQKWMVKLGGKGPLFSFAPFRFITNLAFDDGMLFFEGIEKNSKYLFAIDATTGQQKWKFKVDASCRTPIIADGILYAGSFGALYAVDTKTGREKWKLEFKNDYNGKTVKNVASSPVVNNGVIYFVTDDGVFYAVK